VLYTALYGTRFAVQSSDAFARAIGYPRAPIDDLLVFHVVFGKSVGQVSGNAVANLGYADVRFLRPVYPGDTLRAVSEVIGLREASNKKAGVVWVTTRGISGRHEEVLRFTRWVLVEKRDPAAAVGETRMPELPAEVPANELAAPPRLILDRWEDVKWATGGAALWEDYQVGQRIEHPGGMTLEESEHAIATRLYQNSARVHFDGRRMAQSRFGKRLVYGGHVISVAYALAFNGLENAPCMLAWNGGSHTNPSFAGDTLYAWTEVLDKADVTGEPRLGALRLRLVCVKNEDPFESPFPLQVELANGGKGYDPRVVLDLDWWGLVPRRAM